MKRRYIANTPSLNLLRQGDLIRGIRHDFVVRWVDNSKSHLNPTLHLWSMAHGKARRVSIRADRFLRDHVRNHRAYYERGSD